MGFLCSSETITYCFCYQVLKHFFWVNAGYLMVLLHFIGAVFIAFMLIFTPLEEGYWIRHIAKRIWPEWTLSSSNSSKHLFFFTLPCGNSFEQRFYCYFFFLISLKTHAGRWWKKKKYLLLICEAFTIEMSWNSGHQSCLLTSHCLSQTDKAWDRWHRAVKRLLEGGRKEQNCPSGRQQPVSQDTPWTGLNGCKVNRLAGSGNVKWIYNGENLSVFLTANKVGRSTVSGQTSHYGILKILSWKTAWREWQSRHGDLLL